MADAAIRAPRSLTEAQRLCERWSELDAEIAAIEAARDAAIAAANAQVDKDLLPLVDRRNAIAVKLEPWWKANAAELTKGKRKSAELGGVMLGTREGRVSVSLARPEEEIVAAMQGQNWAAYYLRTKVELSKAAVLFGLSNPGPDADQLTSLGLAIMRGPDVFRIERTKQAGTQGKVQR